MIENTGELNLEECGDANIPVNCFLRAPNEDCSKWTWTASNFMPRKESVYDCAYSLEADTKEEILEEIAKYVVPLYETALSNLKATGELYYWS